MLYLRDKRVQGITYAKYWSDDVNGNVYQATATGAHGDYRIKIHTESGTDARAYVFCHITHDQNDVYATSFTSFDEALNAAARFVREH